MVTVIQAEKVKLYDLEKKFNLKLSDSSESFLEWQQLIKEINVLLHQAYDSTLDEIYALLK